MNFTKIVKADLDPPRRELSNGCLGIVIALLVCPEIIFSCVSTGGQIQLYEGSLSSSSQSCRVNCCAGAA